MPDILKFLADECCDMGLTAFLRKKGYDVSYISEQGTGAEDDTVLQKAYTENRILITEDKDFGELVFRLRKPAAGVIFIRIPIKQRHLKCLRLEKLIDEYSDRLSGRFVVVDTFSQLQPALAFSREIDLTAAFSSIKPERIRYHILLSGFVKRQT